MRSLLAVSALHMAQHRPERKDFYVAHAILYHQIASRTAIELMRNMETEDAEALWIFSVLTVYFGESSTRSPASHIAEQEFQALGSPRNDDTSLLIGDLAFPDWLFLLKGVKDLLNSLRTTTYTGVLAPMVALGRKRWIASHEPKHMNSNLLGDLEELMASKVTDASILSIYRETIRELRGQLSLVLASQYEQLDIMDAFVWRYTVADTFMPLLKAQKQEAVAIFAHSCIILNRLESYRWLQGWGEFLISRAWEMLDAEHRLWIQWPIEEIGWIPP
ncbi:Fc.00g108520.m01.CDS01 [Cosmosporella sp. VM-42]